MTKRLPKIGVIGVGYVGSAVSTGFESIGCEVREYDKYKDTESIDSVVNNSDILFVCVPTPMDDEEGFCDTTIVESVAKDIVKVAEKRKIIINKSTVPPGTTQAIASCYKNHAWVFNPEFLTEKNFINDFMEQDRIVLGASSTCTEKDMEKVWALYEAFVATQKEPKKTKIWEVTSQVAEMVKYAGNAFLSTKVMFFNEIEEICRASDIDFEDVRGLVGLDKRIGYSHTKVPGPDGLRGFGGKCFPKDIRGLIAFALDHDVDPLLLDTVWSKNLLTREEEDWRDIKGATTECSYDET